MNKATILMIGTNKDRQATLLENFGNRFYTLIASDEETAIDQFLQASIEVVLFNKEMDEATKDKLTKIFKAQQKDTIFFTDDVEENMINSIVSGLEQQLQKNRPSISFNDDALKNAGLNIQIQ